MALKIAVVGTGVMGLNHLRVYSKIPGVKLIAVVDNFKDSAEKAAKEYNCKAYLSVEDLLTKEKIDAAVVAVPTKFHFEIASQFIEKSIPVLVEKPLTFTASEAKKLIELAKRNHVLLMPGHVERFNPVVIAVKRFLESNRIGKIVSFTFRRIGLFPARVKDINVIQDIGVHDIDLLHYLSSQIPRLKGASAGSAFITGRYDYAQMLFELNHASAVIECNWITPTRAREFYIVGDKGMLKADLFNQTLEFFPTILTRDEKQNVTQMQVATKSEIIPVEKEEPLKLEVEHFINCVKNKKTSIVSPEDAVLAIEIANEATNSLMKRYAVKKVTRFLRIPDSITNKLIKQN